MFHHKLIISLSITIFFGILIYYIVLYNDNNISISIGTIYLLICISTYPIGFYTCYRLAYKEENIKKDWIDKLMNSIYDIGAIFIIPLLLSPFVIKKYVILLVKDYNKLKEENDKETYI